MFTAPRCALAVILSLGLVSQVGAADLAAVGAKIYPSPTAAPIEAGTVLVHDGRIAALGPRDKVKVPAGAQVIDGAGKVVTAGFWNSHVHFMPPPLLHGGQSSTAELNGVLDAMLNRWGFTGVVDLASLMDGTLPVRARIAKGEVRGPTI